MPATCDRRTALRALSASAVLAAGGRLGAQQRRPPNGILIFTDDQGYGDAGVYGAQGYETPNLDSLAARGARFTDFYAAHASCSPSRAGLLTGCYPWRVGIPNVLGPRSAIGLNPDETTIADMLKARGYATAMVGKWHLGDEPGWLPTHHGFDEWLGLPYSHDMWPVGYDGQPAADRQPKSNYPPLPLMDGEAVVETIDNLAETATLTQRYTARATDFIRRQGNQPFFLYFAHSLPHVPLAASADYAGSTARGLYGDVIREIDGSVGEVLQAVRAIGQEDNTLILFTSDNGPWLNFGHHAGSAGPLREGKGTTFDGGQREIFLAQWPGVIPAGTVCREPAMAIDLLPTIAEFCGAPLPAQRIDGLSIAALLQARPGAVSPHEALFFHYGGQGKLEAVRAGRWKLHFPHSFRSYEGVEPGRDGFPGPYATGRIDWALYDLAADLGERHDVKDQQPDIVARLRALGEAHDAELKANARPPARRAVESSVPAGQTEPKRIVPGPDGSLSCLAVHSTIHGRGARYVAAPDRRNIGSWSKLDTTVSWDIVPAVTGRYEVIVVQALGDGPERQPVRGRGRRRHVGGRRQGHRRLDRLCRGVARPGRHSGRSPDPDRPRAEPGRRPLRHEPARSQTGTE